MVTEKMKNWKVTWLLLAFVLIAMVVGSAYGQSGNPTVMIVAIGSNGQAIECEALVLNSEPVIKVPCWKTIELPPGWHTILVVLKASNLILLKGCQLLVADKTFTYPEECRFQIERYKNYVVVFRVEQKPANNPEPPSNSPVICPEKPSPYICGLVVNSQGAPMRLESGVVLSGEVLICTSVVFPNSSVKKTTQAEFELLGLAWKRVITSPPWCALVQTKGYPDGEYTLQLDVTLEDGSHCREGIKVRFKNAS